MKDIDRSDGTRPLTRRTFLTGAATGGLVLVKPSLAFSAEANSKIELGLIGCGGRGNWIAKLFAETGLYQFAACADYFQDRVDKTGDHYGIGAERRYTGMFGYANETVAPSVRSNLTAVLGREAGYRGGEVTFEQLLKEGKRLKPDLGVGG